MQDSAQAAATEAHGTGEMPRGEMVSTTAMGMPRPVRISRRRGEADALAHWCESQGLKAKALHLVGYGDEEEPGAA